MSSIDAVDGGRGGTARGDSRASTPREGPLVDRLLDAAEAEIDERGTTEVSLRSVARRAGVSHQAPNFAFGDRAGLLAALAARGYRLIDDAIIRARDSSPPDASARAVLAEMGVAYVLASARRPALLWLVARPDLWDGNADLGAARQAAITTLMGAVQLAMDEGWHAGEAAEDVAVLCWASVHGLAVLHRDALRHLADKSLEAITRDALRVLILD